MPYVSPVQCLCNQCVGVFENANPATAPMLRQAVADGRVNPEIELFCVPAFQKRPTSVETHRQSHFTSFISKWCGRSLMECSSHSNTK